AVARRNANRHGVADRIRFALADVYDVRDESGPLGGFDLIVSNPPYVSAADVSALAPEIRNHEPKAALTDNSDRLDFYRQIAPGARSHLEAGEVIVEVGAGQKSPLAEIFERSGFQRCIFTNDLAGIPRVLRVT